MYRMDEVGEQLGRVWSGIHEFRATLAFIGLLFFVYGIQLAIAGSFEQAAAYGVARDGLEQYPELVIFVLPLLHSYHGHVVGNSFLVLVGGVLLERRVGSKSLLLFLYFGGLASNILPALLGFGGVGIGNSGAGFGLWTFFGVAYVLAFFEGMNSEDTGYLRSALYLITGSIGLTMALTATLQFIGVMPISQGVGAGGHLMGVLLGIVWYRFRPFPLQEWSERIGQAV